MAIIAGVTEKAFTSGKELQPLLSELVDCASYPRQVKSNQKIKHLIEREGAIVSEADFSVWFKCVCLKSQKVILSLPNGNTKNEYKLRICIASLSPAQRAFIVRVMDTTDANAANCSFLERVKTLLEDSLR